MKNITESEKKRMLKEALRIIQEKKLTPYYIAQGTSLSTTGIQKIIDGVTKSPQISTVKELYNFVNNDEPIAAGSIIATIDADHEDSIESRADLLREIKLLEGIIENKDRQIKDKEEIISLLKDNMAMRSQTQEDNTNVNTRPASGKLNH